jgi:hypothetical protein
MFSSTGVGEFLDSIFSKFLHSCRKIDKITYTTNQVSKCICFHLINKIEKDINVNQMYYKWKLIYLINQQ